MRDLNAAVLAALLLMPAPSSAVDQPPQILGTWYGQYQADAGGDSHHAEMWMEIFYQLSEDGWDVRGHNRWNVLDESDEKPRGADSGGREHEYYDTVSGIIERDGKTIHFTEEHRHDSIDAVLTAPDTMELIFHPKDDAPGFKVTLQRIDTHYQPSDINRLGIDISHHSGKVNWKVVKKQGYEFAYVKCSEGVDDPDPLFEEHWENLRAAGMPRGAYHFYVTEDDPVEQAKFFASRLKDDPGTLPPAVDVELLGHNTDKDTMTQVLMVFLETFEKEVGIKPVIYTSSNFWDAHYSPEFSDYALWMAEYGVRIPKVPFGWKNWLIWQRKQSQAVKGVEKSADINLLHPDVDLDSLRPRN